MHLWPAVVAGVLLGACAGNPDQATIAGPATSPQASPTAAATPPRVALTAVTMEDVLNGTYPTLIGARTVTLANGEWRTEYPLTNSAGKTVTARESTIAGPVALGDLNGDAAGDAVVVLAFNGGGSGTFMRLVPVLLKDGKAVAGRLVGLGDRVNVRTMTINEAGTARLDAVVHQIGDGLCCPTLRLVLEFELREGALRWRNPEVCTGRCTDPIGSLR